MEKEKWASLGIGAFSAILSGVLVYYRRSKTLIVSRLATLETSLPILKEQAKIQMTMVSNQINHLEREVNLQFKTTDQKIEALSRATDFSFKELENKLEGFEKKFDTMNTSIWEIKLLLQPHHSQANKESPQKPN